MKKTSWILLIAAILFNFTVVPAYGESNRKERRLIMQGNDQYKNRHYVEAQSLYEEALKSNPGSAEANYNLGLSLVRQVSNPADTTARNKAITDRARKSFTEVAALARTKPGLAAKANYNLGNIEFNAKEYQKAIEYYKQALRIDPNDERARKNLRIAQLNLQKNNQNQNKDQNKDKNKDQNQDQNKNQQQNQQQNSENNNQDKEKDKNKEQNIDQQAAARILQAVDNKENQTRARVNKASKGDKSQEAGRNNKRW